MKYISLIFLDFYFSVIIGRILISFYVATVLCDLRRLRSVFRFTFRYTFRYTFTYV